VIIVNQTSRTYARVSFWVRRDAACTLTRKFLTTTARIGRNGTVDGAERTQGSMTTPRGTYTITETFGNGPAPYTSMPYHRTRQGDYWVGDNTSRYCNTLRISGQGGFRWWLPQSNRNASENLRAYGAQYRYVAVINFNRPPDGQQAYRGFAIFLHVKSRSATAGCLGITAGQMEQVLRYLRPGDKITIRR
jgi:L,D-peptidoglycan transpeptidase YkuD (ErfK/YbiS/YcfS/YnhG family)